MKRKLDRVISLLLCAVMLLELIPAPIFAELLTPAEPEAQSEVKISLDRLTAYCVDAATGEEVYGFGKGPFDLAAQKDWGSYQIVPALWDEAWTERTELTSGTTEFFWCYSFGKDGFTPLGMTPGKWGELVQQHREKHPDDNENILLIGETDGWTTNRAVPVPCTMGELLGIDAPYYLPNHQLVMFMRHTTVGGDVFLLPYAAFSGEVMVMNSASEDGWSIPTEYPAEVGARPVDWGYGNRGTAVSKVTESVPAKDGSYLKVYADINEPETSVVYLPHTVSAADGMLAPGSRCMNGLDNGTCPCFSYLWVVPAKGDTFPDAAAMTPMDFVPVGMSAGQWQSMCDQYAKQYPKEWAGGDYSGLYSWDKLGLSWTQNNRLPLYSELNIAGTDLDHSLVPEDYTTRTYACLVRWEYTVYTDDGTGNFVPNTVRCFGFGDPVTILPEAGSGSGETPEPDQPGDGEDTSFTQASPLPAGFTKGLEWFGKVELACDAEYDGGTITYQWYRSLTADGDGDPFDDDYSHGTGRLCSAEFPAVTELDKTYYYYCEYSFIDGAGQPQTHRTTTCALRRAPCSMLEVKVSPGAFYLEADPDNTDYYSPAYMRSGNETRLLTDPEDYTLPYAYQVYGGESVLSAWIETESALSSSGFRTSDYVTWQWYKSPTEDWTQGEPVGEEGRAEGLTEISVSKNLVSGAQSVISYNALNKHANIHVDCPTDTLEPFYMTVVVTNHYTTPQGQEVTAQSVARCKVFTLEKNEDLYSVDANGVLNGYNGHESVWNIPASVGGQPVTAIGQMAQTVRPPAGSDARHHAGPTRVVIPAGVTEICDAAFFRLYSLEEVELPGTLRKIGSYAFADTGEIGLITLPGSVTELGTGAFMDARLQEFAFDADIWPTVGGSAFFESAIRQVTFPANAVGRLSGNTFYNCANLGSVQNWTNILELNRDSDFKFTPAYAYLVEGGTGDSDGSFVYEPDESGTGWAVVQCILNDTETLEIPASFKGKPVTTLGRGEGTGALAGSQGPQLAADPLSVKHVVLPDSVHTIRQGAFDGCENLETVNFHSGIQLVGKHAFRNCYKLRSDVVLASGAYIQTEAFLHCRSITALNAPGAHIAHYAFAYCFQLAEITDYLPWLPERTDENAGVYTQGYLYWPFAYTKTYTDARESVRYYHSPTGEPNQSLALQHPGRRYGDIHYDVWPNDRTKGTVELYMGSWDTSVTVPGTVPAADGDYTVTLAEVAENLFRYMNASGWDVIFGEGVARFRSPSSTALTTSGMRHVTLPQTVTDLGTFFRGEYSGKSLLESINIPAGVTELAENAFEGNKKLHTVTFGEDSCLQVIGKNAFMNCASLQEIDFSNLTKLTIIGENAFMGCDLRTIDLRVCTMLTTLARYAFSDMENIRAIRLPDNLEEIGIFAFADKAARSASVPEYAVVVPSLNPLQELVLPANLKKIGKGAFRGQFMDNAANAPFLLQLPEGLEEIGSEAFGGYQTYVTADMELWSNIALKDGKLPQSLKVFGCWSTAGNDDDNGENMYSPFAYSSISTLTFPAGVEILGINACKMMPKLTTVIFEAGEQIIPGSDEPLNTGAMRELHPGSLDCGYVPEGWARITDIRGFENLRRLEYMESVFGQTAQSWTYPGDSYTVPGTLKQLGTYALNDYGFSPFRNIVIEPGVQQIDQNAISKWAQQVGDYVTALDKAPRDTALAERWLAVRYEEGATDALLRCYTGSAYHLWAEKYGCSYELLDGEARVLFLDLTLNGVPVTHPEQWLGTCLWTDSRGNPVGSEYIFREAREGETYTVKVGLNQEKLRGYALPVFEASVKVEAGQRYAYVQLPLSVRDSITVRGVLPQHREPGFAASVVQTHYPYSVITQVLPDAETGAFSVQIPFADCKLVLTTGADSPYADTVYKNFAMMGLFHEGIVDAGTLPMEIGPMVRIPITNADRLRDCGSLILTDVFGNRYSAFLVSDWPDPYTCVNYLSIKSALQAGITIGDTLTLSSAGQYTAYMVMPVTFAVPAYNQDFGLDPETVPRSKFVNMTKGACYLYGADGLLAASCTQAGSQTCLPAGTYTALVIGTTMFYSETLEGFLDMNIDGNLYLLEEIVIAEDYGETVTLETACPEFNLAPIFGMQFTADSTMTDAEGRVPVYLQLNLADVVPVGPTDFQIRTNRDTTPFVEIEGQLAVSDQPGTLTNVESQSGGGHVRSSLSFTTTARTGVITFYAKADGSVLDLSMKYGGNFTKVIQLKLPDKSFTLNEPPAVTQEAQGVLTLFAGGDANHDRAVILVDGRQQSSVRLYTTGSGANALPYTLQTYTDGSSLHTLQVEVYDKEGTVQWVSPEYSVIHTNLAAPQPRNLDIRITNMNATWHGTEGSVDGVNTVEHAGFNFSTGEYKPMKFVVPYFYYNDDGTMAREITFDYSLTVANPELITNGEITLKVYCREVAPYVREVKLYYNTMTGTFDGTLFIPGGTITVDDLPYGFSLAYAVEESAVEPQSVRSQLDQVNRDMENWQAFFDSEAEKLEEINLDHLHHWMEEEGITGDEREQILQLAAVNNQITETLGQIRESMLGITEPFLDRDSEGDALEQFRKYLQQSGTVASVEPLSEPVTRQELLEWGFLEMQYDMGTVYILPGLEFSQMIWLDPEKPGTGLTLTCGTPQLLLAAEGPYPEGPSSSTMETLIRQGLGLIATLSGAITISVDETTELLKKLSKQLGNYKEAEEILQSDHWKQYGRLRDNNGVLIKDMNVADEITLNKQIDELQSLKKELKAVEKAAEAGDINVLRVKMPVFKAWATGASKLLGGAAKFVPIAGTLIGGAMAIWDAIGIVLGIHDRSKDLDKLWAQYDKFDAMINDLPEGVCHDPEELEAFKESQKDYWWAIADIQAGTIGYYTGKIGLLATDVGTIIVSLAVGIGNVAAGILGLGSAGIGLGMDAFYEYSWKDSIQDVHKAALALDVDGVFVPCEEDDPAVDGPDPTGDDPADSPDFRTPPRPMIDPSGYVYEAVASNRIQGATARVYYRDGEGNEIFWDEAPLYDEINPQITDSFGAYGWMTPPGKWLVKITKEGYLPADSENDPAAEDGWLPVPPPQLNVNIPLVSVYAPRVESAAVAADRAQLIFSQYMEVSQFVEGDLVTVTQNGTPIPVTAAFADAEVSPADDAVYYGRILVLTRTDGQPFAGDGFEITVAAAAKNYADRTLESDYESGALPVTRIVGSLAHSYPNRFVTDVAQTEQIVIRVLDTTGQPMENVTVTARQLNGGTLEIPESALSDADGRAVFPVTGLSSGYDTLFFETGLLRTVMETRVNPLGTEAPQKPTANLQDYQRVTPGTELVISCGTEDAVIYYTADDTCPCQEGPGRFRYTGPIPVTETALYRIAAYTDAGGYSERLNLHILAEAPAHVCRDHLTHVEAKPAECAVDGNIGYYACDCGKYFEDAEAAVEIPDKTGVILPAGHDYGDLVEEEPAVHTATELKAGMKAHYLCSRCSSCFTAEKVAATAADLVIPAPTHSYTTPNGYKTAEGHADTCACGAHGPVTGHTPDIPAPTESRDQTCSVCGYLLATATGHLHRNHLTHVEAKPAECTVDGNIGYYACDCGKYFADAEAAVEIPDKTSVILPAGHDYGDLVEEEPAVHTAAELKAGMKAHYLCGKCGSYFTTEKVAATAADLVIPAPTHSYTTPNGYKTAEGHADTCACGAHGPVTGHTPDIPAPTESRDQTCSACGYLLAPATGHLHRNHLTHVMAKPAECTVDGNLAYYACDCGKYFADAEATVEIPDKTSVILPAGHDYGDLVEEEPAVHTAAELKAGMKAHYLCGNCGSYFTAEKVETTAADLVIPAPAHSYTTSNGYKTAEGHADTCVCGAHGPVTGHTPDIPAPTESRDQTCSACGYLLAPATGHLHRNHLTHVMAKPAECTVDGNLAYYACDCGKYFADAEATVEIPDKTSVILPAGHDYGDLVEEQPAVHTATELKAGMKAHHLCGNCGSCFTAEKVAATAADLIIPAPTHSYTTPNGYKTAEGHADTCVCGARGPVTGHTPDIPAPTESRDQTCSACGYLLAPATGHLHRNHLTHVEAKPAECTVDGNIGYYACDCGKYFEDAGAAVEILDKTSVILPAGHDYGDLVEEEPAVHTATELKAGMKAHYLCGKCGSYFTTEKVAATAADLVIPAPTHSYTTPNGYKTAEGHADTCVCGARGPVTGHTPDIPAPTESRDQTCSACGYLLAPATGHLHRNHLTHVEAKPAECTVDGNIGYYACDCGKYFADAEATVEIPDKTSVILPAGHDYGDLVEEEPAVHTATELKAGMKAHYLCSRCGSYFTAEKVAATAADLVIPAPTHSYTTPNGYKTAEGHADTCVCSAHGPVTGHTPDIPVPTESQDQRCAVCGYLLAPATGPAFYIPEVYTVKAAAAGSGTLSVTPQHACEGQTVTVTAAADAGYRLQTLTAMGEDGGAIVLTHKGDGRYTFRLPACHVTVTAVFAQDGAGTPFADVPADAYYREAVLWAVREGITKGTGPDTFSPDAPCTRAQMAAFLWRAAGSPIPEGKTCVFADVAADAYYREAVQWAYEQGITSGTGPDTFSPDAPCTRAQMAAFLCRMAKGTPEDDSLVFADVPADAYYAEAVRWAYEQGITLGTGPDTFSPDAPCTRAQMVTFLYRCFAR